MAKKRLLCEQCHQPLKMIEDLWGKRLRCVKCRVETELNDQQYEFAKEALGKPVDNSAGAPWDKRGLAGFLPTVWMVLTDRIQAFSIMKKSGGFLSPLAFMWIASTCVSMLSMLTFVVRWMVLVPWEIVPSAPSPVGFEVQMLVLLLTPLVIAVVNLANAIALHFVLAGMAKLTYGVQGTVRAYALTSGTLMVAFLPFQMLAQAATVLFGLPAGMLLGGCMGLFAVFTFYLLLAKGIAISQECSVGKVLFAITGSWAIYCLPFTALYIMLKSRVIMADLLR